MSYRHTMAYTCKRTLEIYMDTPAVIAVWRQLCHESDALKSEFDSEVPRFLSIWRIVVGSSTSGTDKS